MEALWNSPDLRRVRRDREQHEVKVEQGRERTRAAEVAEGPRKLTLREELGGIFDVARLFVGGAWRAYGVYNHDPYIARISITQEAQRQLALQRQLHEAERAQDQDHERERMKMLAEAFFDEAERRRSI